MKQSIEKEIKDSGYNIKEKELNKEWEEFYNYDATLNLSDDRTLTNFLLWKILKKLEAKK